MLLSYFEVFTDLSIRDSVKNYGRRLEIKETNNDYSISGKGESVSLQVKHNK